MIRANYHTHTHFCDGKNTPEELVLEAIRLGCPELGFSGHSYTPFDVSYCMTEVGTQAYIAEIEALRKKYAGQIKLRLGIELDYYGEIPTYPYDYRIGSVHYIKKDGCYLPVDESKQQQIADVNQFYSGDFYGYIEDYYRAVADVYRRTQCQIIGHFDLVTKFNAAGDLFDTRHPRYQAAAQTALDALLKTPAILEVNFGAIARGYATDPYPARDILTKWLSAGKPVIYSSDCHNAEHLLFGFDRYQTLLQQCQK